MRFLGEEAPSRERRPQHCEEMVESEDVGQRRLGAALSHSASEGKGVRESLRHCQATTELTAQWPKKANERCRKAESLEHIKHVVILEAIEGLTLVQ